MKLENEQLIFDCTGNTFYQYANVIGIDPDLNVTYGYDGSLSHSFSDKEIFTQKERVELANHMINLWTKFRETKTTKE